MQISLIFNCILLSIKITLRLWKWTCWFIKTISFCIFSNKCYDSCSLSWIFLEKTLVNIWCLSCFFRHQFSHLAKNIFSSMFAVQWVEIFEKAKRWVFFFTRPHFQEQSLSLWWKTINVYAYPTTMTVPQIPPIILVFLVFSSSWKTRTGPNPEFSFLLPCTMPFARKLSCLKTQVILKDIVSQMRLFGPHLKISLLHGYE